MGSIFRKNNVLYYKKPFFYNPKFQLPPGALGSPGERPRLHWAPSGPHGGPMVPPWEDHYGHPKMSDQLGPKKCSGLKWVDINQFGL